MTKHDSDTMVPDSALVAAIANLDAQLAAFAREDIEAVDAEAVRTLLDDADDPIADAARRIAERVNTAPDRRLAAANASRDVAGLVAGIANRGISAASTEAIEAAQKKLRQAEDAVDEARLKLEAASDQVNLDEMLRLRPLLEVVLPGYVDEARLALLDTELCAAREAADSLTSLAAEAEGQNKTASARLDDVRTQLYAAEAAAAATATTAQLVTTTRSTHQTRLNQLEMHRADLAGRIALIAKNRARKLAGLPALGVTDELPQTSTKGLRDHKPAVTVSMRQTDVVNREPYKQTIPIIHQPIVERSTP